MTDRQILEIWNEGRREEAFGEIVRSYSERLYWQIRPIVGSHEDADDVLQEAFVRIWTALPSFRGEAQLYTWVFRIAVNTAITWARRNRTSSTEPLDPGFDIARDADGVDGDRVERLVASAIASLPPKQRAVFSMRYFDEMPYEDISRILGASVGALKASYHFAAEKVRKKIGDEF